MNQNFYTPLHISDGVLCFAAVTVHLSVGYDSSLRSGQREQLENNICSAECLLSLLSKIAKPRIALFGEKHGIL